MRRPWTHSRLDARICLALAVLCFACGLYAALHTPWLCVFGFYGAACLAWCAARLYTEHRSRLVRHERARRAAVVDSVPSFSAPVPCCAFWRHTEGAVHGPDCTRPSAPRHVPDGLPLDAREAAAFEAITAHFDDRSAA
ncbi:hypothetical protein [Streptomyces sp. NPDC058867]|uniref:hypothetical protein n=1 Tax=unclassified Streptomyces TaxID=2593676 RepID=UPI003692D459